MSLYNFHSGFTTQEKELYARILDLIPALVPVIEECMDKERAFNQFVKLVCVHSCFIYKCY
jgi:PII-like signaling protein